MENQNTTEGTNPQNPSIVQQTVIVSANKKSVGVAFVLAFLFGPLGLLYASVTGGIIMIVLTIFIGIFTLGFGAIVGWLVSIIWAVVAANSYNEKQSVQNITTTTTK